MPRLFGPRHFGTRLLRSRFTVGTLAVATTATFLVSSSAARADQNTTFNACKNDASGLVRMLPSTALPAPLNTSCDTTTTNPWLHETAIAWNQVGPQGPAGAAGGIGPQGPQGNTGATGLQGAQGLTGSQGPAGSAGPAGPKGADGRTVLNGTGAPTSAVGTNGDFYVDTAASILYGPKAAGTWASTGVSLVGPTGAQGPQGLRGDRGLQGLQGATGAQGPAGTSGSSGILTYFGSGGSYTVPSGVRQIIVEARGGGGGACAYNTLQPGVAPHLVGGGQGAYVRALIAVAPGAVYTIAVGSGGTPCLVDTSGCSCIPATPGDASIVGSAALGNILVAGGGGAGNGPLTRPGGGGTASLSLNASAIMVENGASGVGPSGGGVGPGSGSTAGDGSYPSPGVVTVTTAG
jgi:hypothetical protein